jgi:hypothetical protein
VSVSVGEILVKKAEVQIVMQNALVIHSKLVAVTMLKAFMIQWLMVNYHVYKEISKRISL